MYSAATIWIAGQYRARGMKVLFVSLLLVSTSAFAGEFSEHAAHTGERSHGVRAAENGKELPPTPTDVIGWTGQHYIDAFGDSFDPIGEPDESIDSCAAGCKRPPNVN
jgi:hypothetical protein